MTTVFGLKCKYPMCQGLKELTIPEDQYFLSSNDRSITYGDNGGIISPYARLGPMNKKAQRPTVINEVFKDQVANIIDPRNRFGEKLYYDATKKLNNESVPNQSNIQALDDNTIQYKNKYGSIRARDRLNENRRKPDSYSFLESKRVKDELTPQMTDNIPGPEKPRLNAPLKSDDMRKSESPSIEFERSDSIKMISSQHQAIFVGIVLLILIMGKK